MTYAFPVLLVTLLILGFWYAGRPIKKGGRK
jgi:hypothetical protein